MKAPGSMLLKLRHDEPLSNFGFNFNLRHYNKMKAKLSGGQFRMLNEALYTQSGDAALAMVQDSPG